MNKKRSAFRSQASEEQLIKLGKILTPIGYGLIVRVDTGKPRLTDGVYIERSDRKWALSLYRNVLTDGNDIEIAIDVAALVGANVGVHDPAAARAWLERQRAELEHAPSGKHHTPGHASAAPEPFRLGLKISQAQVFAQRLSQERMKQVGRWNIEALPPAVGEAARRMISAKAPDTAALLDAVISRMIANARSACSQSGKTQAIVAKNKEFRLTEIEARKLFAQLLADGKCAISGLALDLSGQDPDLAPSLDRKNSDGHYEADNVQVVAWFVNRWKGDDRQENFGRLLSLLRN